MTSFVVCLNYCIPQEREQRGKGKCREGGREGGREGEGEGGGGGGEVKITE